jgi:hypothetical protein
VQQILDEYFIEDGTVVNQSIKKSVLLSLERDLAFCVALPGAWQSGNSRNKIQLSETQYGELIKNRPTFAVISLFCTAIDVMARVANKRLPPGGQNSIFFKESAQEWFGLSEACSEELWNLRNGISHGYRLIAGQTAVDIGSHSPVERGANGRWVFYLNAMYTSLGKAKRALYESLSAENSTEKQVTVDYLNDNGFFFTLGE